MKIKMTIKELRDKNWIIYEIIAGSKLYNIDNENSDIDIRGVFNVPLHQYLCQRYPTKIVVNNETTDVVFMEIVTYLNLACEGNPNVIDWLFASEAETACKSLEMSELVDVRDQFITKRFLRKSLAMAESMLKRCKIKEDKQWKMLAHTQRLLFNVYTIIDETSGIYSPRMTKNRRDLVMNIKNGNVDYWNVVSNLEQGVASWYPRIDETNVVPELFNNETKDDLIIKFKTKYELETIE